MVSARGIQRVLVPGIIGLDHAGGTEYLSFISKALSSPRGSSSVLPETLNSGVHPRRVRVAFASHGEQWTSGFLERFGGLWGPQCGLSTMPPSLLLL